MVNKKWYNSKTIWAGIITIVVGVYNALAANLSAGCVGPIVPEDAICYNLPAIPDWIFGILGAFGIYGRTTAKTEIK